MRAPPNNRRCLIFPVATVVFFAYGICRAENYEIKAVPESETALVALKTLSREEAFQIAGTAVSKDGRIGYLPSRHMLVIHDYPANIQAIKDALKLADTDPVNIRIEVEFLKRGIGERVEAGVGVKEVTVRRDGSRPSVTAQIKGQAGAGKYEKQEMTRQSVLAGNGREATIWVGKTVYDSVWVRRHGLARGWWDREVIAQDLGASLCVRPRLLPDGHIQVSVFPRITARGNHPLSIDVMELSTDVVVLEGFPVSIGGLDEEKRQGYARLFGVGRVFDGQSLAVTLTPKILRPQKQRPPASD